MLGSRAKRSRRLVDIEMFSGITGRPSWPLRALWAWPQRGAPALPASKDALLEAENLVLVDVGCVWKTTVPIRPGLSGSAKSRRSASKKTLEAVQEAQHKAIRAIHPGVLACDVYKAARGHFESLALPKPLRMGSGMASDWKP